jgi:hypothetical protein
MHYEAKILHSNHGIQGVFALKSRTGWMAATPHPLAFRQIRNL